MDHLKKPQRWRWSLGRRIGKILIMPFAKLKIFGQENLLLNTGKLLVSNHTSNLDPFFLGLAVNEELYFLAKEELFLPSKFFSWLINSFNAIPISRNLFLMNNNLFSPRKYFLTTIKKAISLLKDQKTLVIFPEGTRNYRSELLPFSNGASFLAIRAGVPIIPTAILGIKDIWRGKIYKLIDNLPIENRPQKSLRSEVIVKFGKPIYPPKQFSARNQLINELTQNTKRAIEMLIYAEN
ncbi:MAG: 1-acyl-sn-glycerol-3-phosphate acyltransferase [candidate division WOR-3 bacterium]|nr:1-acyl-sn-glycerol-3-phosphate acyltransferase [candidate division WOR-3 bacterium]